MESQRIEFTHFGTLYRCHSGTVSAPSSAAVTFKLLYMLLFPRRLQLSCTRKILETFTSFVLYFTAAFRVCEVILQLSHTCLRSRESVNIEQGIPTGEMLRACIELTRALLGQSAQAHSVGDKMETQMNSPN